MNRTLLFTIIALLLGIAIYLSFDKLLDTNLPDYAINIASAFFGAVLTIIITAVLLNAQSLSELGKEKSVGVFNAKLEMYVSFLDVINNIIDDNVISKDEIRELRKWTLRMSLISGSNATSTIGSFIDQTINFKVFRWSDLDKNNRESWIEWFSDHTGVVPSIEDVNDEINHDFITIGKIIGELKIDLGEIDISNLNQTVKNMSVIDGVVTARSASLKTV